MDLQNIVINFTDNYAQSLFNDKCYPIPFLTEITDIKPDFETAFDCDIDIVVIQLTEDQHGSESRFLVNSFGSQKPSKTINMADVAANNPVLMEELRAIRLLIEAEIESKL
jgi:hypothetical protein